MDRRLLVVALLFASVLWLIATSPDDSSMLAQAAAPGCQFLSAPAGTTAAFCDTFDAPAGTGNRAGDLNGTVWGVSRITGHQNNGLADGWFPTQLNLCGTMVTAQPESDVRICNGHVVEATNDGGSVTALAMYPKQPFDIAGRTGTVSFEVSDDSQGTHAAWPEFWYSDKPVPDPFTHQGTMSVPANGFGVRFAAVCQPGQGLNCAPNCPANTARPVVTVDSAVVVRNGIVDDSFTGGSLAVQPDTCIVEASGPTQLNHIELRVSTARIDVYGTDAFTPGAGSTPSTLPPLKHLATIPNATLTLTRGLIWLEDAHYNADKAGNQGTHTFAWDNVAFDGPVLPQDRAFDALDNTAPGGDGSLQLGWSFTGSHAVAVPTVTQAALDNATGALLTFGVWSEQSYAALQVSVNGHAAHTVLWPYPGIDSAFQAGDLALPIPLAELQAGTNTVTIQAPASGALNVFNLDLIAVGGGGTVSPTPSPSVSPSPTSTPSPTETPTPTPTPTGTPLDNTPCVVLLNGQLVSGTCSGTFTP